MGIIFVILGGYLVYNLWSVNTAIAVVCLIATLYYASSVNEMTKEVHGMQPDSPIQFKINIVALLIIIGIAFYYFTL